MNPHTKNLKHNSFLDSNINFSPTKGFRETNTQKMGRFARSFFESIQVIVVALAVVVIIYLFVASFNIVDGTSMFPTFHNGDLIISEKLTTNWGSLQRGDVVVFLAATEKDFIKRIIGMPGDKVKISSGKVYVNGIALNEPYLSDLNRDKTKAGTEIREDQEVTSPPNHYIVMGDNRDDSLDSRFLGPIEKNKIKGKAWLLFWPLNRFKIVEHEKY